MEVFCFGPVREVACLLVVLLHFLAFSLYFVAFSLQSGSIPLHFACDAFSLDIPFILRGGWYSVFEWPLACVAL